MTRNRPSAAVPWDEAEQLPAKRQRKPSAWAPEQPSGAAAAKQGRGGADAAAGEDAQQSSSEGGLSEEAGAPATVTELAWLNGEQLEVVVEGADGKRYRGVVDRTALPHGVGVPVQVTKEELEAVAAAPPRGQNPLNLCGLCNQPLEKPPVPGPGLGDSSSSSSGLYVKVHMGSNWVSRVHLPCAVWSPEVYQDEDFARHYVNMRAAIRRGRSLKCKGCKERGATLGCFKKGCPAVYHLPCAAANGCTLKEDGYEVWCPAHAPKDGQH